MVDQLNEFLLAPNTTVRLQLRNQIIQHLDKIERLSQGCRRQNASSWG
nr:Phosphoglycerate transport system sensor protein pgtB [Klebsiella pneumoniae]